MSLLELTVRGLDGTTKSCGCPTGTYCAHGGPRMDLGGLQLQVISHETTICHQCEREFRRTSAVLRQDGEHLRAFCSEVCCCAWEDRERVRERPCRVPDCGGTVMLHEFRRREWKGCCDACGQGHHGSDFGIDMGRYYRDNEEEPC